MKTRRREKNNCIYFAVESVSRRKPKGFDGIRDLMRYCHAGDSRRCCVRAYAAHTVCGINAFFRREKKKNVFNPVHPSEELRMCGGAVAGVYDIYEAFVSRDTRTWTKVRGGEGKKELLYDVTRSSDI